MKNKIFYIELHSFIDVITNSSSELFVCDTDKSLSFIKSYLDLEWDKIVNGKNKYKEGMSGSGGTCNCNTFKKYWEDYYEENKQDIDDDLEYLGLMDFYGYEVPLDIQVQVAFDIDIEVAKMLVNKNPIIIELDDGFFKLKDKIKNLFNAKELYEDE